MLRRGVRRTAVAASISAWVMSGEESGTTCGGAAACGEAGRGIGSGSGLIGVLGLVWEGCGLLDEKAVEGDGGEDAGDGLGGGSVAVGVDHAAEGFSEFRTEGALDRGH